MTNPGPFPSRYADVHVVLALSSGGADRARHAFEELRAYDEHLASRTTVVATRADSPMQRLLAVATACTVGEVV